MKAAVDGALFTAYGDSVVASGAPEKSFEVALTAEGVKARIVKGSYLPNHNFFGPEDRNMTIGFIELPDGIELLPVRALKRFWKMIGAGGTGLPRSAIAPPRSTKTLSDGNHDRASAGLKERPALLKQSALDGRAATVESRRKN
jgi:hypothetical protein